MSNKNNKQISAVGPRQQEYEREKRIKKMHNKIKWYGVLTLFLKANFVFAAMSLWQTAGTLPLVKGTLYHMAAVTLFGALIYVELHPFFALPRRKKTALKQKPFRSHMEEDGLKLIES